MTTRFCWISDGSYNILNLKFFDKIYLSHLLRFSTFIIQESPGVWYSSSFCCDGRPVVDTQWVVLDTYIE